MRSGFAGVVVDRGLGLGSWKMADDEDKSLQALKRQKLEDGGKSVSSVSRLSFGGGGGHRKENNDTIVFKRTSGAAKISRMLEDSDDSDDDKPLVSRMQSSSASKPKPLKVSLAGDGFNKGVSSSGGKLVVDKKPVVEDIKVNIRVGGSINNNNNNNDSNLSKGKLDSSKPLVDDDSDDDKPLASRKPLLKTYVRKDSLSKAVMAANVDHKGKQGVSPSTGNVHRAGIERTHEATTSYAGKTPKTSMDIDTDDEDDDVPLAQRLLTSGSLLKKTFVAKAKSSTAGAGSSANQAKKFLETRKAKTLQVKKLVKQKKVMKVTTKSTKKEPGSGEGVKWQTLEHNGVIFPPAYESHGVKMLYDGKPVDLTHAQEEVATMFAVMKETDYATKPTFIKNFWDDWKKCLGKNHVIKKFDLCDFTPIYDWFQAEKERKKSLSGEEKKRLKEEKLAVEDKYMWALVDGVKEKVGNFRVEPPGLFRGRGDHPKMGKLKTRIMPKDIVINIGRDAPVPECPIPGQRWKEVRHDNTVTWLAYWNDPINNKDFKYVFLAASSNLKGQSDMQKYEKARTLKDYIHDIRKNYTEDLTSPDLGKKQIAVATYLIDRLALRAGNEKDEDEADTVGCCSLKVEHVSLVAPKSLQFDFLGKDSIRYFNVVEVDERVYKAIGQFKKGKKDGEDLFETLDTSKLNVHLKTLMPGLTAKVFRTYNASVTLDDQLKSTAGDTVIAKIADYQRANKEVAILCNHQRSVSKGHSAQMERLEGKMTELETLLEELENDLDRAKKGKSPSKDADGKVKKAQNPEALEKKIAGTRQKIDKMKLDMSIKDDLKTVALGTSKINYMDPRITVAWCKRHEVPIEKIFNKSLLAKFAWAMEVEPDFQF